jgi:phosphinothricin acetyltransferase
VVGYAYACRHRERAAYRWAADVSVYITATEQRHGHGRRLYEELFERLRRQRFQVAVAGITLPNPASVGLHSQYSRCCVLQLPQWPLSSFRWC